MTSVLSNPNTPSPTVADEYSQASDGYDRMLSDDTTFALEKEKQENVDNKDLVDGTESLYNTLYERMRPYLSPIQVDGTEGFLDTIKAGVAKILELIHNFFSWLKALIFGKSNRIKRKSNEVEQLMRTGTLRSNPTPYPQSAIWLYKENRKVGELPGDLLWLSKVQTQILDVLNRETDIQGVFSSLLQDINTSSRPVHALLKEAEQSIADVYHLKKNGLNNPQGVLVGSAEYGVYGNGTSLEFSVLKTNGYTGKMTFTPDITTVRALYKKNETIESKLKTFADNTESYKKKLVAAVGTASAKLKGDGAEAKQKLTAIKALVSGYTSHVKKVSRLTLDATLAINTILADSFK